jgi:hypothetical protein
MFCKELTYARFFGIFWYTFEDMKARKYKPRPGTWVVAVSAKASKTHKRENHYFRSENAAKEWIVRFKREHAVHGQAAISSEERRWINFFRDSVGDLSTLPKVVEHWQTTGPDCITKTTVSDAVEHFLEWRALQGRWSPSTAEDTASRLGIFKRSLGDRFIHELRPTEIEDFLGVRGEVGTRVKFFNKLRPVFRYAKRRRFVAIDPMDDIRPPATEYKEIEIYQASEMARMLAVAEESASDMLPFLALMAFGFLRTEELISRFDGDLVLDWSAFDWVDRQIFVPHTVAKKARDHGGNDRQIPISNLPAES